MNTLTNCTMARESEGEQVVYRLSGAFDRSGAWALRETLESDPAPDVLLDFSLVRDFSDLGVAVLAHGLIGAPRRVLFRGLRQHQVRIFRYCGFAPDEFSTRDVVRADLPTAEERV